jgi:hypothetical protein
MGVHGDLHMASVVMERRWWKGNKQHTGENTTKLLCCSAADGRELERIDHRPDSGMGRTSITYFLYSQYAVLTRDCAPISLAFMNA